MTVEPFTTVTGRVCPIDAVDVDTDQILPKQFLKRIERTGFGEFAFFEWRYADDGTPRPEFAMNKPEHAGANILLAGRNFGCGSSREHAPWALQDAGFRVIIAPSFADIFRSNCANIGVLTVTVAESLARDLFARVAADPGWLLTVDLDACELSGDGFRTGFTVDPHVRHRLRNGLDSIGTSLQHVDEIAEFERRRPAWRPRILT